MPVSECAKKSEHRKHEIFCQDDATTVGIYFLAKFTCYYSGAPGSLATFAEKLPLETYGLTTTKRPVYCRGAESGHSLRVNIPKIKISTSA